MRISKSDSECYTPRGKHRSTHYRPIPVCDYNNQKQRERRQCLSVAEWEMKQKYSQLKEEYERVQHQEASLRNNIALLRAELILCQTQVYHRGPLDLRRINIDPIEIRRVERKSSRQDLQLNQRPVIVQRHVLNNGDNLEGKRLNSETPQTKTKPNKKSSFNAITEKNISRYHEDGNESRCMQGKVSSRQRNHFPNIGEKVHQKKLVNNAGKNSLQKQYAGDRDRPLRQYVIENHCFCSWCCEYPISIVRPSVVLTLPRSSTPVYNTKHRLQRNPLPNINR